MGRDHYELATTLTSLGNAYGALGNASKQQDLLERALKIKEAHYGQDHYQVVFTLVNLSDAYGALEDVSKQRDLLERALKIQEAHCGQDHYQVAVILTNLGNVYSALGNVAKQRDLLERALKIDEAHYGWDHLELTPTLASLAGAYYNLQRPAVALQAAQRAYHILKAHTYRGAEPPMAKQCLRIFQSCGFTLAELQTAPVRLENYQRKRETPPAEYKVSVATTSVATLLSQQGLLGSQGLQETQIQLGRAILALVTAINMQRTVDWEAQAHLSFTATVVSAFAKGQEAFDALCLSPTEHSIPPTLGAFIQAYVAQHPDLRTLSTDPNFANQLKRQLSQGNLEALHQYFGLPYSPEPAPISQKSTCVLM